MNFSLNWGSYVAGFQVPHLEEHVLCVGFPVGGDTCLRQLVICRFASGDSYESTAAKITTVEEKQTSIPISIRMQLRILVIITT